MAISLYSAKEIVKNLNDTLRAPPLNRATHGPIYPSEFEEYYKKLGSCFLEYLHYEIERSLKTAAVDAAWKEQRERIPPHFEILAKNLCLAKLGIGSDGSMAAAAWLATVEKTEALFIETVPDPLGRRKCSPHSHSFVLLGVKKEEFDSVAKPGRSIEFILDDLEEGILLDPHLEYACRVSEFEISPFKQFNRHWKSYYFSGVCIGKLTSQNLQTLVNRVDTIYQQVKQINFSKNNPISPRIAQFLEKKYREDLAPRIVDSLNTLFPAIEWEGKIENYQLKIHGKSEEDLEEFLEILKNRGIESTSSEEEIILSNVDPEVLEKWIKEGKPKQRCCYRFCKMSCQMAILSFAIALITNQFTGDPVKSQKPYGN